METAINGLAEPDVLAVVALAGPPVLAWDAGRLGMHATLASLHVAEHLDGIDGAALVRVNPVLACTANQRRGTRMRIFLKQRYLLKRLETLWGHSH